MDTSHCLVRPSPSAGLQFPLVATMRAVHGMTRSNELPYSAGNCPFFASSVLVCH
jgi:hypothetical protein